MVVIIEGKRPTTIRSGTKSEQAEIEADQLERIRAAMAKD